MPYRIEKGPISDSYLVRVTGAFAAAEILAAIRELEQLMAAGGVLIWELSAASLPITTSQVGDMISSARNLAQTMKGGRSFAVAPQPVVYGLARGAEAFAEAFGLPVEVIVVKRVEEVWAALGLPAEEAAS